MMSNSLSMTFHYSNWIMKKEQLSPLFYNVYTDDLNHHLQATGVGCYAEDIVLLVPWVTALQILIGGMYRICWNS